jgi:hypothetical protein
MFDFDKAYEDREAAIQAKIDAENAQQEDIDARTLAMCSKFTDFAKKKRLAISASRQGNTVTLDAGPRGKMKVLALPDAKYRLSYEGASGSTHVYDDLNAKQPSAEELPGVILDWAYEE